MQPTAERQFPLTRVIVLLAETAVVAGLTFLDPVAMLLGFVLSAHAMVLLPRRVGIVWIAFLVVITGSLAIYHLDWVRGLLVTFAYMAGYASFGFAYYARERANTALQESEALVAELQTAQRQLRDYAARVEELVVAEEHTRLAREMHDTLGHRLTVTSVQLEGAQRLIPSDPERAARMIGTARQEVQEGLSELRRTVSTLRTPLEADLALPLALRRMVDNLEDTETAIHLVLAEELPPLPSTHRLALYRIAQEALTNVQRHARASNVWIRLRQQENGIVLEIEDNGIGLGASQAGFGLRGMRERARQLGGELVLSPRPGGGTRITARIPLERGDG
jgi:signal transduction histidine kinase